MEGLLLGSPRGWDKRTKWVRDIAGLSQGGALVGAGHITPWSNTLISKEEKTFLIETCEISSRILTRSELYTQVSSLPMQTDEAMVGGSHTE